MSIEHNGKSKGGETNIRELVPEITQETNEEVTDAYIDLMLLRGKAKTEDIDFLERNKGKCKRRIERLNMVSQQVDDFLEHLQERFTEEPERKRIKNALSLMLKVHINQKDRVEDGKPFVSHPLAVAERVLDMYDEEDASFVCVAALLHDSVEDEAHLIYVAKRFVENIDEDISIEQVEKYGALHVIGHLFGMRTMSLVSMLSNTKEADDAGITQEEKNTKYFNYVNNIFNNDFNEQAASVIKWADLQENAFIGTLYKKAQEETDAGNEEEYKRVMAFYLKMKERYEPVLRMVRDFFDNIEENHPLFKQRLEYIEKIDEALENQYMLA